MTYFYRDIYEIPDDDDVNVNPRPLTPPPNIPNISLSGVSRQAVRMSRCVLHHFLHACYN